MSQDTLRHPTLKCLLRGKPSTSTVQFRNLKYASIPGRWQDSSPNGSLRPLADGLYDATKFGPSCPQGRAGQAWDLTLVGNVSMPLGEGHGEKEWMDENECLNVNVTVPKAALEERGKAKGLPVFVWVHGGGLSIGSNSWPQYNLTRLIERSIEIGKPVIGVSINYRLGVLGFLTSRELGTDGNYGFKDQLLAFRWVKKHIAGFGGDPNNITAAAESAGGISLSTLLCADVGEGLFDRVVIMSGETTLRKPRSRAWHEEMYQDQLKLLSLQEANVGERTRILRSMPAEELQSKLPLAQHFCACVDGKFLKEDVTLSRLSNGKRRQHKPAWCKEFVIGDTAHDGTCLKTRILDNPKAFALLKSLCDRHLTSSETANLLSAYNLPAPSAEQEKHTLLELASELRFYLPTLAVHVGWKNVSPPKLARRYHFHVPNPVEGAFKGLSSHELDVTFLLQNFNEHFDERGREVAQQMADQWITFANGEDWCDVGKVVVIGNEGVVKVDEEAYDDRFRGGRGKVLESIGAQKLWKVAELWQGVRSDIGGTDTTRYDYGSAKL
ncbi:para-nitrobenzyl esterase [Trematosphaeria pertusa]|uniref:Para-nitrobenzyl esterase n=1 Tax=Trematosphaeria pertusa TaxID=390896 RepID=A0A6A6IRU2_9PLEO|nr:para-nitrobenzyl esterase [Trematosphaeria pertusa]KAF2253201.1 para-nitrobenzyl esterase [Trematosphaeria pertusa]